MQTKAISTIIDHIYMQKTIKYHSLRVQRTNQHGKADANTVHSETVECIDSRLNEDSWAHVAAEHPQDPKWSAPCNKPCIECEK